MNHAAPVPPTSRFVFALLLTLIPAGTSPGQSIPVPLLDAPLPGARPASAAPLNPGPALPHPPPPRAFNLADFKAQVPLSPEGHFLLTVPQICHTVTDPQVRQILTGRTVQTLAEVRQETTGPAREPRFQISRQLMPCCASHATSYSLALEFGSLAPPEKPTPWAVITGRIEYRRNGLELVPVLQVLSFEAAPAPPQPVLH